MQISRLKFKKSALNFTLGVTLGLTLVLSSACSTLVGNVRPVEEKSETYGLLDLNKADPDWVKLNAGPQEEAESARPKDSIATEISDIAYQSRKTASIISLNSACREVRSPQEQDLRHMSDLLFLGLTDITFRSDQPITLQGTQALETTLQGKLNTEEMMLRTVVLRRGTCIYDLVYMARPRYFETQLETFSRFVASLRLK